MYNLLKYLWPFTNRYGFCFIFR